MQAPWREPVLQAVGWRSAAAAKLVAELLGAHVNDGAFFARSCNHPVTQRLPVRNRFDEIGFFPHLSSLHALGCAMPAVTVTAALGPSSVNGGGRIAWEGNFARTLMAGGASAPVSTSPDRRKTLARWRSRFKENTGLARMPLEGRVPPHRPGSDLGGSGQGRVEHVATKRDRHGFHMVNERGGMDHGALLCVLAGPQRSGVTNHDHFEMWNEA